MKTFEDFQAAFPDLYSDVRCGFYCPTGWLDAVWELSTKLAPLGVKCDQVKEKFGVLRFYTHGELDDDAANERMHALIDEAEAVCGHLCEQCGKPGVRAKRGPWLIATLCEEHAKP